MSHLFRLALVAALALAGACDDVFGPDSVVLSEEFSLVGDATGRSGVAVLGLNGNITINGDAAGEMVMVEGFRRVSGCGRADAEEWLEALEVRITETAEEVVVETVQPLDTEPCGLEVEYQLSVPARLAGRVDLVNGEVVATGLEGGVSVTNVNGNVVLDGVVAPVLARVTNGSIETHAVIESDESIDLLTVNGNVLLTIPASTSATLSLGLVNGVISVTNLTVTGQTSTTTSLEGMLGGGAGTIVLRTTNGHIAVTGI